jgi:hypothetical protein
MPYPIAGIDVHKKMLAVVVSDLEIDGEFHFERRMFGANPEQPRWLAAWLLEQEAEEVVGIFGTKLETGVGCHWNATGSQYARSERVHAGDRERCIWRRHSPIVDGEDARGISLMPNVWESGSWPRN